MIFLTACEYFKMLLRAKNCDIVKQVIFMKLLIIRHGDPDYTIDSLTEKGWREAELLSARISRLEIRDFYCSPLGRAKATAKATLEKMGRTAEICDWLKEFPGYVLDDETGEKRLPWDQLPAYWTNLADYYDKDKWLDTPLMSSGNVRPLYRSVCTQLDLLLAEHGYRREKNYYRVERENDDTLVFFCHFGIECVLLSHLLGISPLVLWQGFVALPTSVTTLITEEREQGVAYFRCNGFGDLSHLYVADELPSFSGRFCELYSNTEERH